MPIKGDTGQVGAEKKNVKSFFTGPFYAEPPKVSGETVEDARQYKDVLRELVLHKVDNDDVYGFTNAELVPLPFDCPKIWEYFVDIAAGIYQVAQATIIMFIAILIDNDYRGMQLGQDYVSRVLPAIKAVIVLYPLCTLIILVTMTVEFAFRKFMYYRLLSMRILVDWRNVNVWEGIFFYYFIATWALLNAWSLYGVITFWDYADWSRGANTVSFATWIVVNLQTMQLLLYYTRLIGTESRLVSLNQIFERAPIEAQYLLTFTYVIEEEILIKECLKFGLDVEAALGRRILNIISCGCGGKSWSMYAQSAKFDAERLKRNAQNRDEVDRWTKIVQMREQKVLKLQEQQQEQQQQGVAAATQAEAPQAAFTQSRAAPGFSHPPEPQAGGPAAPEPGANLEDPEAGGSPPGRTSRSQNLPHSAPQTTEYAMMSMIENGELGDPDLMHLDSERQPVEDAAVAEQEGVLQSPPPHAVMSRMAEGSNGDRYPSISPVGNGAIHINMSPDPVGVAPLGSAAPATTTAGSALPAAAAIVVDAAHGRTSAMQDDGDPPDAFLPAPDPKTGPGDGKQPQKDEYDEYEQEHSGGCLHKVHHWIAQTFYNRLYGTAHAFTVVCLPHFKSWAYRADIPYFRFLAVIMVIGNLCVAAIVVFGILRATSSQQCADGNQNCAQCYQFSEAYAVNSATCRNELGYTIVKKSRPPSPPSWFG